MSVAVGARFCVIDGDASRLLVYLGGTWLRRPRTIGRAHLVEKAMPVNPPRTGDAMGAMRLALFLTGFGAFLNLNATQPLLPYFRRLFEATELQVSLTVSASALAVALAAPLAGWAADRLGRKPVILTAMVGVAVATGFTGVARTLPQLIAWRFLQGLWVPGIAAVAMAYVTEEAPAGAVGRTMATYVTGTVLGGFAGRFLNGLVAPHWGWRMAFLLLGVLTLVSAAGTAWRLPASRHFVRERSGSFAFHAFAQHIHNRQLLATYAVGWTVLLSLASTFTYVNFYLADPPFHLGPTGLASVFGVYVVGAAVTPGAGRLIDRLGYRRALLAALAVAALGVLLTLISHLWAVLLGLTLLASGVFACQAAASSHVGVAAGHARSSAAGLYVSIYYLGGSAGSVIPGLFWGATGWPGCVAFVLGIQVLAAGVTYAFWEH
jgi:MFS transporter, YNFM family, putative membrane transport protein